jgi:hypothetical protein
LSTGPSPHARVRLVVELLVALAGLLLLVAALRADRVWYEHHMTWRFCVAEASELVKLRRQRWLTAALGVALLIFVRPRAGRWAARRSGPLLVGELARYGLAATLAIVACDVFLRYVPLTKLPPEVHVEHPDASENPRSGWNHVASHRTVHTYAGKVVTYDTDSDGDRVEHEGGEPDPRRPTILFPGESITSGIGLHYAETYPALVGARLGMQVVNQGVHGYGSDNEYIRAKDALERLPNVRAVVTMVIPSQVGRNADDTKKVRFVLGPGGTLEPAGAAASSLWRTSPVLDLFARVTRYHSDAPIALTRTLLRAIRDLARAHGAVPLFVLTHWRAPCLPDETGRPSIERTLFDGEDLPHVTVDLEGTWIEVIEHAGPEGHVRLADAIVRALDGKIAVP